MNTEASWNWLVDPDRKGIVYIERIVKVNGKVVLHELVSPDHYRVGDTPLNRYENWIEGGDVLFKETESRENSGTDRCDFLSRLKPFWRKLLFKNVDLQP